MLDRLGRLAQLGAVCGVLWVALALVAAAAAKSADPPEPEALAARMEAVASAPMVLLTSWCALLISNRRPRRPPPAE